MTDRKMENRNGRQAEVLPDLDGMVRRVGEHVNRILRENLYEMHLSIPRTQSMAARILT